MDTDLRDVKAEPVTEDVRTFADFAKLNKNCTLDEYRDEVENGRYDREQVKIAYVARLTQQQFSEFQNNLLTDCDFLKGLGGNDTDWEPGRDWSVEDFTNATDEAKDTWRKHSYHAGVYVVRPDGFGIIVDPQGHSYARYVGINVGLVDFLPAVDVSEYTAWL